eukprot:Amastigsp_a6122_27.p3 type:complete len:140 gc:universal Amastigsp_a6122_27:512-93(-)
MQTVVPSCISCIAESTLSAVSRNSFSEAMIPSKIARSRFRAPDSRRSLNAGAVSILSSRCWATHDAARSPPCPSKTPKNASTPDGSWRATGTTFTCASSMVFLDPWISLKPTTSCRSCGGSGSDATDESDTGVAAPSRV